MLACHRDKMRFNILDGKSSVVWPSSLLPGLESKCCEGKGGLPSVVTHLNAKDAFPPFISLISFTPISFASSISLTFFHFTVSLFPLSPSSHLPSNFYPALLPLSSSPFTQLHLIVLCSVSIPSLKVKNHSISFTWHFCLQQYIFHWDFRWQTAHWK